MLANLLQPKTDLASLNLRVGLAAIFTVHGYFKIVQDFSLISQLTLLEQTLVGWAELVCGLLLLIGLFSRLAALALIGMQTTAIALVTWKGALAGPPIARGGADYMHVGPEYNLVLISMCLGVILLGSGLISVDYLLVGWWRSKKVEAQAPVVAGVQ